jgi:hypothetical protein
VRRGLPIVAIVGYTNAGKSTLLNTLTRSDVLAEDRLFATLDPTTRRLRLPREREIIIADTVGFIRDLPAIWRARSARRWRSWTRPTCCCTSSTPRIRRTSSRSRPSRRSCRTWAWRRRGGFW